MGIILVVLETRKKRRQIVVFSPDYPPLLGGIASYSHGIAHGFSKEYDVTVLAKQMKGARTFDASQPYRTIRIVNVPVLRELISTIVLVWLLSTKRVDAIYNCVWFPYAILSFLAHVVFRVPYFIAAHGADIIDDTLTMRRRIKTAFLPLKRPTLTHAQCMFPVSGFTKEVLRRMGVSSDRIVVVSGGVDHRRFHPNADSASITSRYQLENRNVLLTVARLDGHKGHKDVLHAMHTTIIPQFPHVIYVIVGDGPERESLELLTDQLHLRDNVIFTGRVSEAVLPAWYARCDVFVMPGVALPGRTDLIEGFGLSFLEANACGKPVVGARFGGVESAVLDGETGRLVESGDRRDLAGTICHLLSDKDYSARLGAKGRQRIVETLTWEHVAGRVMAHMEASLELRSSASQEPLS